MTTYLGGFSLVETARTTRLKNNHKPHYFSMSVPQNVISISKGISTQGESMHRYVNVEIQTWLAVSKINYAFYGYAMLVHVLCLHRHPDINQIHTCMIKEIHGQLQPVFPYKVVTNIRKMTPCLNFHIHMPEHNRNMTTPCLQ